jgi:hypothetical protein
VTSTSVPCRHKRSKPQSYANLYEYIAYQLQELTAMQAFGVRMVVIGSVAAFAWQQVDVAAGGAIAAVATAAENSVVHTPFTFTFLLSSLYLGVVHATLPFWCAFTHPIVEAYV